jgi:tRNA(Arg) A34 adenosine deaminase TadA
MNALAAVDTAAELGGMTLWSSYQPCSVCAAACEFTGVGRVRFIAPDPSDDDDHADPDGIASSPDDGLASRGSGGARTPRAPGARPAEGN